MCDPDGGHDMQYSVKMRSFVRISTIQFDY